MGVSTMLIYLADSSGKINTLWSYGSPCGHAAIACRIIFKMWIAGEKWKKHSMLSHNFVGHVLKLQNSYPDCETGSCPVNFHHLNIIIMTVSSWTSSVGFSTWRFPKIGLPPVLIHFHGNFPDKNHPFGDLWCSKTERQSHPQPAVS